MKANRKEMKENRESQNYKFWLSRPQARKNENNPNKLKNQYVNRNIQRDESKRRPEGR